MGQAENLGELSSATGLPDTSDAIEIAMAAVNQSQPLPDIARTVLEKHAYLLDKQASLAEEEARLAKKQAQELELKHVSERVQAGLWLLLAAGVLSLLGLIGWAAWRAANTQALVVEPFAMPPALVAQGLTGEVAATRTLDEVKRMLGEGSSARSAASYENDWGDDLKIDIPNTGLTMDQGWKLLRRTLGKETRFSGDVVQNADSATIAVRIASGGTQRFSAPEEDVDQLFVKAAEFVLRETQPYRYAAYISQFPARIGERQAVLEALAADPSPVERSWATLGMGNVERTLGNLSKAEYWYRRTIVDAPDFFIPYNGLASLQWAQGKWQEALATWHQSAVGSGSFQKYGITVDTLPCINIGFAAKLAKDRPALESAIACFNGASMDAASRLREAANLAFIQLAKAQMDHDIAAATATAPGALDPMFRSQVRVALRSMANTLRRLEVATDGADRDAAEKLLRELDTREQAALADAEFGASVSGFMQTLNHPIRAEAEIMLGRLDRAEALLAGAPDACLPCTSAKAKLAQAQGDVPSAAIAYDAAVKLAPALPHPLVDRGRFLLGQRKWAAAESNFRAAERLSRGWADPQKYLGDALAAQGRRTEARASWSEAVRRAPKWPEAQAALAAANG